MVKTGPVQTVLPPDARAVAAQLGECETGLPYRHGRFQEAGGYTDPMVPAVSPLLAAAPEAGVARGLVLFVAAVVMIVLFAVGIAAIGFMRRRVRQSLDGTRSRTRTTDTSLDPWAESGRRLDVEDGAGEGKP
jgi:hypothetical protein